MAFLYGLAAALGAAIAFGIQYVPVKKYEIYDGTTFQWFMCNGILFIGILIAVGFQQLNGCPIEVVFGGVLWSFSNFLVLPLVKLLGIGLGFSMYHFVNLAVGYLTGRLGLFGVPPVNEVFKESLFLCDFGCALVLISFVILLLVEQAGGSTAESQNELSPPFVEGIDAEYREMYRRWRLGEARGSTDAPTGSLGIDEAAASFKANQSFLSVGGFNIYSTPAPVLPSRAEDAPSNDLGPSNDIGPGSLPPSSPPDSRTTSILRAMSDSALPTQYNVQPHQRQADEVQSASRWRAKFLGVLLALAGGGICGVQSVPATLYNEAHPTLSATAVVFPQCVGIWLASTSIYLIYSSIARLQGWPVKHSVIRPAFFSGGIWGGGFSLMIFGIRELGYSVGYTLDAVGPIIVSSLLSILVFKEIKGRRQLVIYGVAELLQVTGVAMIGTFGKQS